MQGATSVIIRPTVNNVPFDFCIARKEKRSYKDPKTGQLCTATRETDVHYYLRIACVQAAEPSFVTCSLVIRPEGLNTLKGTPVSLNSSQVSLI